MRLCVGCGLFTAKTEPDQVDRPADSHEQTDQGENPLIQPLVQSIADATPENQAGEEVSKDRPHCIFIAICHGDSFYSSSSFLITGRGKCRRSFI